MRWDAQTSQAICPAPIWQCRRSAADYASLIAAGCNDAVGKATGLDINPLFPASKLAWVRCDIPTAAGFLAQEGLHAGTVDAWLLRNLTGGERFACDRSNAARTQLFDTRSRQFSAELAAMFDAPLASLPDPLPSDSGFGHMRAGHTAISVGSPILSMMGDSHAALCGPAVRAPGIVKETYGTGSSPMTLTPARGKAISSSRHRQPPLWRGCWGVNGAAALSDLAQTVPDSAGGRASGKAFPMQMPADLLDRPVQTADVEDIGALRAAAMAFAGLGHALPLPDPMSRFAPNPSASNGAQIKARWAQALRRIIA